MATVTEQVIVIGAGQSGLAAADALIRRGIRPMVLEAGAEPTGSWSHYYDSLRLFTPARLNALRGVAFPGDPTRYPTRDQVTDYLRSYAARLDCDIRTDARVDAVTRLRDRYEIRTADGAVLDARSVIAATGQFDKPHHPRLPSLYAYTGTVRHVASYRNTEGYHGLRVIVVGSGNSAVQIAVELSAHARVSIASRAPIRYAGTEPVPGNSRFWTALSHAGRLPIGRLFGSGTIPVIDTMGYRKAIEAGRPDHRPLPIWAEGTTVHWPDGSAETVDVVLLATGYRPALDYLGPLVLLGSRQGPGIPNHRSGLARDHPGLAFVGLDNQRTILSSTLHGVTRDATHVADALSARLSHSRQSRRKRSRRRS